MGWGGELLTGETQAKKRQSMVDIGSNLDYVGVTLTAACTMQFLLTGRGRLAMSTRPKIGLIGQKRRVRSIWIRAFIDELIDHEEENSSRAVDRKRGNGGQSKAAPKISIAKLVKSVLSDDKKS